MLPTLILTVSFYSFAPVISTTTDMVEVRFEEQGKFLALLPINLNIRAIAYADGKVKVNYPWYSFLTITKQEKIKSEMNVAVDNALRFNLIGSVKASGEAANKIFTAEEAEEVAAVMQEVLEENLEEE